MWNRFWAVLGLWGGLNGFELRPMPLDQINYYYFFLVVKTLDQIDGYQEKVKKQSNSIEFRIELLWLSGWT